MRAASVSDFRALAKARLPHFLFEYVDGGSYDEVTLGQIYKWTLALPEFEDDPSLANDDILYAIYQDWFEENIHGQ